MKKNGTFLAWMAWVSVCFFWGTTFPAIHVMVKTMPPLLAAGLRQGLAGAVLLTLCLILRIKLPALRTWLELAWAGFLIVTVANGLAAIALKSIGGGLATVLNATAAFWVVGLEAGRKNGEKPGLREIAGLIVGFVGLIILVKPDTAGQAATLTLPAMLLLIMTFSNAAGYVYLKHHEVPLHPLVSTGIQLASGGLILTMVALAAGERLGSQAGREGWMAFAYLMVFGSMVGYFSFVYMMKRLPSHLAVLYVYICPLVAIAIGTLLLGEAVSARFWLGAAVILLGVALVQNLPMKMMKSGLQILGYE